jgi:hypothetical protein
MKILCLDLSTHAGYAFLEGERGEKPKLIKYGTIHLGKSVVEYGPYPYGYVLCARAQIGNLINLLMDDPDVIVIEETNMGRNRYTQKLLEFLHHELILRLEDIAYRRKAGGGSLEVVYLDSSEWRSNLGLKMSKEQKKLNAKLSKAKREAAEAGSKLDKKKLGIKGKTTAKHLAVAHANESYDLKLKVKDNDAADAICLGLAYCNNATPCDGV